MLMSRIIPAAIGTVAVLGLATNVAAQVYPSRPITMIVPFAAGGPTDAIARVMSDAMSRSLGESIVVENITGASGSIGVGHVAHAASDGYTLLLGLWSTNVINSAVYDLPYDLLKDFEPIALLPNNPMLVVAFKSGCPLYPRILVSRTTKTHPHLEGASRDLR